MPFANQKGNVITYVIIAMTTIAALAVGALYMTSSSVLGELGAHNVNRAYLLAQAGKEYALIKNLGDTTTSYPAGRDFTLVNGDIFRLVISGNTITSTGIVNIGTPFEVRRTVSITKSGFSSRADISFAKDIGEMTPIQVGGTDLISKTATSISLGKIGSAYQSNFGAIYYGGSATEGNCVAGKCNFGTGIRAFFTFQFASGSQGDGFTFAIFNGSENDTASIGGYSGYGELMGYAGDSYVSSGYYLDGRGRGIQPPKVAVEFDPFPNPGIGCLTGRNDGSLLNHMALVFWGDNTTSCTSNPTVGKYTFDDNIHGAGTNGSEDPKNGLRASEPGGDACSYFNGVTLCGGGALSWPSNWLLNWPSNVYAFRIEVKRKLTPEASGYYQYRFKVWIKRCDSGDPACTSEYSDDADYLNTKKDYTTDNPTLDRIIEISSSYHQRFENMIFGWTMATGSSTQNVSLYRFRLNFVN